MQNIQVREELFERLQQLATPLVDTPETVIARLVEFYEQHEGREEHGKWKREGDKPQTTPSEGLSSREPRQRGVVVEIDGETFDAYSLANLYELVLKFLLDEGYMDKLKAHLPISTSSRRYLIAKKPEHSTGKSFVAPVEYKGYYMEAHKDYKNGIRHLAKVLDLCGLSLKTK